MRFFTYGLKTPHLVCVEAHLSTAGHAFYTQKELHVRQIHVDRLETVGTNALSSSISALFMLKTLYSSKANVVLYILISKSVTAAQVR